MPKINDLNLKNWQEKFITIFGDKYKIRKTYDINGSGFGIYGYDVCDEKNELLRCFENIENLAILKSLIKANFYK